MKQHENTHKYIIFIYTDTSAFSPAPLPLFPMCLSCTMNFS